MKRSIVAVLVLIGLIVGQTPADAHIKKFPTTFTASPAADTTNDFITGPITSAKAKCIGDRTITILDSEGKQRDQEVSSAGGGWKASYDFASGDVITIVVKKKKLRRDALHVHICKKLTTEITAAP